MFMFAKAILEGTPIRLFNHGKMRRDFTYVDDVSTRRRRSPPQAEPMVRRQARSRQQRGALRSIYNIGNNNPEDLMHVVSLLEKDSGRTAVKGNAADAARRRAGDLSPTSTISMRDVGFRPATPIEDGIARFRRMVSRLLQGLRQA